MAVSKGAMALDLASVWPSVLCPGAVWAPYAILLALDQWWVLLLWAML